ncbi:oligosaccharide flippase family protein [Hominifimenecus sp. rT4P-3]|uniref:oligosaccharide flippase family protein n=1 Tax=Hominifimenecus sp. rT4P-3 TaxID=3242979 RepID=UPI003DA33603
MEKTRSVTFNFVMNCILTVSSMIFPLLSFPYVSRVLQPAGTGKVSFAVSVVSYFSMAAMLGVPTYGIRACARVRDDKKELSRTVQEILCLNILMGILAYAVFFLSLIFVERFQMERNLFLVVGLTIGFNVIGVEWMYKGLEQYTYITVRSLIFKAAALIFMFFMIRKPEDYVIYGGLTIFASVGSNLLNFLRLRKYIFLRPQKPLCLRRHLRPVAVFFAMSVATTVYTNLDTVMLGFMKNDAEVGLYNAAVKIKSVLVSVVTSLGAVLLPRVSYYVQRGFQEEFERVTKKALEFVVLIGFPVAVYFILFAESGILLLSGPAYQGAVPAMQMIMPTVFFIGLTNIIGLQVLVPLGREKIVFYSECAGAVVDVILNAVLIPKMGAAGAAAGTLAAEMAVFAVQFCCVGGDVRRIFLRLPWRKIFAASVLAAGLSYLTVICFKNNLVILLGSAVVFWGCYMGCLGLWGEPLLKEMVLRVKNRLGR